MGHLEDYVKFNIGKVKHSVESDKKLLKEYELFCFIQTAKGQGIPTYLYWLINVKKIFIRARL